MTREAIYRLYDCTYWAFERVWDYITQSGDEQFTQSIDYSVGSIRNHVVQMMSGKRWMTLIQGVEVPSHLTFTDYMTRTATKAQWDMLRPMGWIIFTRWIKRC
jgi:uncharacterized damage-inducible protein DinB